jgi:hypothetical protein
LIPQTILRNLFAQFIFIGLTLAVMGIFQGCSKNIQISHGSPEAREDWTPEQADRLWAAVLKQVVDAHGWIDFAGLARDPSRLRAYVSYVGHTAPHNRPDWFPDGNSRLAYYLNSYNALAMYGVVELGVEEGFTSLLDRAEFFKFTRYSVGGEWISLLDYENEIIRPLGDPRVHFALNCMVRGCPRLPGIPFQADHLDQQLERATREFLNQSRNVQIRIKKQEVHLSEILDFYTEDFVDGKQTPTLIDYINRYRETPIPVHYSIRFIPYDWTLNRK